MSNNKPDPGHEVNKCLKKLDEIEEKFQGRHTLLALFEAGLITGRKIIAAGDFNLVTWSHSSDGAFSVGVLEKTRNNKIPFPEHEHEQRLWLLCSKGTAVIVLPHEDRKVHLNQGDYVVVEPFVKHIIQAESTECILLMVTIPADPGMYRSYEK